MILMSLQENKSFKALSVVLLAVGFNMLMWYGLRPKMAMVFTIVSSIIVLIGILFFSEKERL